MNEKNHSEIGTAMIRLRPMLAGYVGVRLTQHFGNNNWWQRGVLDVLYDDQKRNLPYEGTYAELTDRLDLQNCILLMEIHWEAIFSKELTRNHFNWIKELKAIRNEWAHPLNADSFDDAATARALDTMALLSERIDEEVAAELRAKWQEKIQGKIEPIKTPAQEEVDSVAVGKLKSWRDVMEPHPDVARGTYRQAEFAADLGQVVRGEGSSEYVMPVEFFARTYLTSGLKELLVEVMKRLTSGNGAPVIQLKTSFGGGKTHSLLALYHLFGGQIRPNQSSAVREILEAVRLSFIPQVHMAVIVGSWENPLRSTLWGEIAMQLSRSTGKSELYEMMRENDEKKMSPGVELLKKIFDKAGACLILIDELVAYGRKLSTGEIESGGTFENLMSFIQELTEAAKASRNVSVVVSVPESDSEVGGELGKKVLAQVEKYIGRVEFIWSPVTVVEGYEIVRRRLFKECLDEQAREEVCAAFFGMYLSNAADFPYESRQSSYKEKLLSCYPIHPKLFDYLYDKWTSLEKFQKTRGVLRLMANVIYHLWSRNDSSALIMPGSIPLDSAQVKEELVKLLGGNWDAIVNSEIDGEKSKPRELDEENIRLGRLLAARKITRTIFMGSAPGSRAGDVRGIEENEIHLGTIQPQDIGDLAIFNDALAKLKANLYYLYSHNTRLWFGVNPTLRKLVDDKRDKFSDDDIDFEIEKRLATWRGRNWLRMVHVCPRDSSEVVDEQSARLVILAPKYVFDDRQENNPALTAASEILAKRGNIARQHKNMLLFMSANVEPLKILKEHVREYKAWREVLDESRSLNLDTLQLEDAKNNFDLAAKNFAMKISQAYNQLFWVELFGETDQRHLKWDYKELDCKTENNISAAFDLFKSNEILIYGLGSVKLKSLLDKNIWRDLKSVEINKLWEYFTGHYYMPRLADKNVLLEAIRKGVAAKIFGLADNENLDGLIFGEEIHGQISSEKFLIKDVAARIKIGEETKPLPPPEDKPPYDPPETEPLPEPLHKRFYMNMAIDSLRYNVQVRRCMDEIVSILNTLPSAESSLRLVVNVEVPKGISAEMKEIVDSNCHDLDIKNFRFS